MCTAVSTFICTYTCKRQRLSAVCKVYAYNVIVTLFVVYLRRSDYRLFGFYVFVCYRFPCIRESSSATNGIELSWLIYIYTLSSYTPIKMCLIFYYYRVRSFIPSMCTNGHTCNLQFITRCLVFLYKKSIYGRKGGYTTFGRY